MTLRVAVHTSMASMDRFQVPLWMLIQAITSASGSVTACPSPPICTITGLHIPPVGSADNSFLVIPPGESFTYEFDLPDAYAGGTFWYHPHIHGAAARQVSRGLAGVFIVRANWTRYQKLGLLRNRLLCCRTSI